MSKVKKRNFDSWSNCNKKWQADKSRILAPKILFQGYLYNVTLSICVFYAIMHDLIWSTMIRTIWHLLQRKTRKRFCIYDSQHDQIYLFLLCTWNWKLFSSSQNDETSTRPVNAMQSYFCHFFHRKSPLIPTKNVSEFWRRLPRMIWIGFHWMSFVRNHSISRNSRIHHVRAAKPQMYAITELCTCLQIFSCCQDKVANNWWKKPKQLDIIGNILIEFTWEI